MTENPVQKRENIWISLGFNLALPIFFLRKGAEWFGSSLGEILGVNEDSTLVGSVLLLVAISFPIGYGIWDLLKRKKWNFISILGALSVLLTGGIGLIPGAPVQLFAIKEAALPAVLGLFVIISLKSKKPLIRLILQKVFFQLRKSKNSLHLDSATPPHGSAQNDSIFRDF